jgi:ribosome-interacting GTPase 1
MPANLTPQYKAAEAEFRRARTPEDRLLRLREMLRTIPKHKGTEHLQADIRTRIKELTAELAGPKKGAARTGPPTVVRREGAAQVALLGPPNTGKSALHARVTGSHALAEPYPFTTRFPQPGMLPFEDVALQLVDLPAVSPEQPVPWLGNALQSADAALLVVDLSRPDCLEAVVAVHEVLADRRVTLTADWAEKSDEDDDPFAVRLPTLLVATRADEIPSIDEELAVFRELTGYRYPGLRVSSVTGAGLDRIAVLLFTNLDLVRVYTKVPGQPPDLTRPFTVRAGQTVHDVAVMVHKEIAAGLRYARLWRAGDAGGRQVGRDYPVADRDVLELHG